MTRDEAQRLVSKGAARWIDDDTIEVQPGPDLYRYGDHEHQEQDVVSEAHASLVRFVSRSQ